MFERFTDRARRVVVLAQEEARLLNHNYIGTEHLLLGMVHEGEGVAAEALEQVGVSLASVRAEVEKIIGRGDEHPGAHIPFTRRAKKVLELSLREALQLGHNYIGTEHILLGLIREGDGVAAQVLTKLGVDLTRARQQVLEILTTRAAQSETRVNVGAPRHVGARLARARGAGMPKLVRVIPIAREVELSEGRRLVLLSLEIWSDWVDLRINLSSSEEERGAVPGTPGSDAWALADDLGTEYKCLGTSINGDDLFEVHETTFAPSPPAEAGTLTLTLPAAEGRDQIQVVVELR